MKRVQQLPFDDWWPVVMKLWRQSGRTQSVPATTLQRLYDERSSPLRANDALIAMERNKP